MFSSLASFIFGSNTKYEANSETTATATVTEESKHSDTEANSIEPDNFVEVTSVTPTSAGDTQQTAIKSGKNKRNNTKKQKKRKGKAPLPPLETTFLNLSDCELDEGDWFVVENEDKRENLLPTCIAIDIAEIASAINTIADNNQQQDFEHINSHSLYTRTQPQTQRNCLRKSRNNTNGRLSNGVRASTLSPSRIVNHGSIGGDSEATADGGITNLPNMVTTISPQPSDQKPINAPNGVEAIRKLDELLVVTPPPCFNSNGPVSVEISISPQPSDQKLINPPNGVEAIRKLEESWFVTPPPCFTSSGPVNMETSPYENLLIEHPSMSVYNKIKTAEETTDIIIKRDTDKSDRSEKSKVIEFGRKKNSQVTPSRSSGIGSHFDRQSVALLKRELKARSVENVQKVQSKKERRDICRTAIQRANKVRDIQSRNHIKRRSDNQYSKVFSNANNNRKSNRC